MLFRAPWGQMTLALSRPTASRFEEMLSHDWFNVAVFQVCFLAQECLSCSCHACSLKNVRAGTVCPVDQSYTTFEAAGPDSPRELDEPLVAEQRGAAGLASFVVRAREPSCGSEGHLSWCPVRECGAVFGSRRSGDAAARALLLRLCVF